MDLDSLSCAKKLAATHKGKAQILRVIDYSTGKWIEAAKARFLIGSKLKVGTGMDKKSVAAFASPEAAEKARAEHGGDLSDLAGAMAAAAR